MSAPDTATAPGMLAPDASAAAESQQIALQPIHLPTDVSAWPPALGWWLVALMVLALLAAAFLWYRRYRRLAFRREALALLAELEQQQDLAPSQLIDAVSALLKRVAITVHGRERVAGRTGDSWLQFLDASGKTNGFTQGPGRSLGASRFQPDVTLDAPALVALCRDWIQKQSC